MNLSRLLRRKEVLGMLLVLPVILITTGVYGYTLGYTLYLSLVEWSFGSVKGFAGLSNYIDVAQSAEFWRAVLISGIYVGGIMISCLILGLGLALILEAIPGGANIFRIILFIPWIIPGFVAATVFMWMFDPLYGVINYVFLQLGLIEQRVGWLGNPDTALGTVMMGVAWKAYPFLMLLSVAGLQSVPRELYDAVDVDGANAFQRFRHVTLPHLQGILLTGCLLLFLMVANSIELLYIATQGGPAGATTTLPVHAYNVAFRSWDFSGASVISIYLLLILLAFIIAAMRANLRRGGSQ